MRKLLLVFLLLSTQLVTLVPGQQPARRTPAPPQGVQQPSPESDDVVRITTNLVQVDAVITDKYGKAITDLKPEEVEIYEDGRQQAITNFSYFLAETSPAPEKPAKRTAADKNLPPGPPARLKAEDVRRTIALVVDDLGLSFESVYYVRRALKKFVDEQMQPGDLVAIIRTAGGMGALQQFTADKRQLYAAIERVKWFARGRGGIAAFAPIAGSRPGADTRNEGSDDENIPSEDAESFRADLLSTGTLGALSYVVRGLRELPGRKSVLLLSDGFKMFNRQDLGRSTRVGAALRMLTDQANRASVVIYTMDARGLQTLGLTAADDTSGLRPDQVARQIGLRQAEFYDSQDGLVVLAELTGGISIRNNNDLSNGIKRVLEDQKGYYLIGYRPDSSTFEARGGRKFHHLSLKVKRPGKFNIRMRKGFFGLTEEDRPKPRTVGQQLVAALASPFGATGVHLQLTSFFDNDPKFGSLVRSVMYIDPHDLTFIKEPDGLHKCVFDVLAITFGDNGVPIDQIGKTFTIKLTDKQYERIQRQGLIYYVNVPIKKAGAYQLRMSVRDSASERIGSASQFIEAPDLKKNRLALSGMVLKGDMQDTRTAPAGATTSGDEGLGDGDAEASPAVRHLKRGMVMSYGVFIYNARLDKATGRPQLLVQTRIFRDGKEIFTGKETPFDSTGQNDLKRMSTGGAIQLGTEMPPGEYVIQVVVSDLLADRKYRIATQWMDFQIVK